MYTKRTFFFTKFYLHLHCPNIFFIRLYFWLLTHKQRLRHTHNNCLCAYDGFIVIHIYITYALYGIVHGILECLIGITSSWTISKICIFFCELIYEFKEFSVTKLDVIVIWRLPHSTTNVIQKLHKISINLIPIKDLATKTFHDSIKTIFTRDLYALCTYIWEI